MCVLSYICIQRYGSHARLVLGFFLCVVDKGLQLVSGVSLSPDTGVRSAHRKLGLGQRFPVPKGYPLGCNRDRLAVDGVRKLAAALHTTQQRKEKERRRRRQGNDVIYVIVASVDGKTKKKKIQ